jgi:tRNA A-37 threonylcarbamoyl transferase component Bud32
MDILKTMPKVLAGGDVVSAELIRIGSIAQPQDVYIVTVRWAAAEKKIVLKRFDPINLPSARSLECTKECQLLRVCRDLSLPVPALVDGNGQSYTATLFVEGVRLSAKVKAYPKSSIQRGRVLRRLGETIGVFHCRLTVHPIASSGLVGTMTSSDLLEQQLSNLRYLREAGNSTFLRALEEVIDVLLMNIPHSDTIALCHGDLTDENIIYDTMGQIVLLDWADATIMPSAMDLASVTSAFSGCCKSECDVEAVVDGYESAIGGRLKHFGFYRALDEVRRCINVASQGVFIDFSADNVIRYIS